MEDTETLEKAQKHYRRDANTAEKSGGRARALGVTIDTPTDCGPHGLRCFWRVTPVLVFGRNVAVG
jgi:hypothetical protein